MTHTSSPGTTINPINPLEHHWSSVLGEESYSPSAGHQLHLEQSRLRFKCHRARNPIFLLKERESDLSVLSQSAGYSLRSAFGESPSNYTPGWTIADILSLVSEAARPNLRSMPSLQQSLRSPDRSDKKGPCRHPPCPHHQSRRIRSSGRFMKIIFSANSTLIVRSRWC